MILTAPEFTFLLLVLDVVTTSALRELRAKNMQARKIELLTSNRIVYISLSRFLRVKLLLVCLFFFLFQI